MRPPSRAIRAALVSGRVRTLSTAKALLARGWIEALPMNLPAHAVDVVGDRYEALVWTEAGERARAAIKPLPPTPDDVVALLHAQG